MALGRELFSETFGHLYPPTHLDDYLEKEYTLEHVLSWMTGGGGGEGGKMELLGAVTSKGEIVGYCLTGPCSLPLPEATASHGEIHKLYIKKSYFGTGVSHDLMKEALKSLQERFVTENPPYIYLGVYSDNPRALRFYSKFGFEKVGEYEFIVGETRDREFIMRALQPRN